MAELRRLLDLRSRDNTPLPTQQLVQIYDGGAIPTTVPAVFLGHPAQLDADDTESATYTAAVDSSVTFPVVVLGTKVPASGDQIVAHAVGGRWVSDDSGAEAPDCPDKPCYDCHGAGVPNKKLLLSWTGVSPVGSGSALMTPNCFGVWDTGCQGYRGLTRWQLQCDLTGFGNMAWAWDEYDTVCGGLSFPNNATGNLISGSPHPYTVSFTIPTSGPAGQAYSAGYRTFTVSDPSPDRYCCWMYFLVTTSTNPLPGVTVSVWTNSGKSTLIATGLTDFQGVCDLNLGNNAGSVYWEVSAFRYTTQSATETVTCGGYYDEVPKAIDLVMDTTYVKTSPCTSPVAKTLHASHPKFGAVTLIYNAAGTFGAGWYATVSYSYPGCFGCPAKTVTVTCFLDLNLAYSERWKST